MNKTYLALFAFVFLAFPAATRADTATGLVGYWTLDGKDTSWTSPTAGTAIDRSGNGNTGTITNMSISTAPTAGKIGQAFKFDGVDDYVSMSGNPVSLQTVTAFTLSAWIKAGSDVTDYRTILLRDNSATDRNYWFALDITTGKLVLRFSVAGVAKTFTSNAALNDNKWHYVTATYDGSFVNIYSDGVSVMTPAAQTGSTDNPAVSTRIGYSPSAGRYFTGRIDEVRIYNRALSATDVMQLYKQGAAKFASSPVNSLTSGLVGYWTLDGKNTNWNTNKTNDLSGNGNTGTITNMSTSTAPTAGKIGQAFKFDGVDDYVRVGPNASLSDLSALTTSAWIKPNSTGGSGYGRIIERGTTLSNGWSVYFDPTRGITFDIEFPTYFEVITAPVVITKKTWHNVIIVWDGSTTAANTKIYVNGVLMTHVTDHDGSGTRASDAGSGTVIGNRLDATRAFDGAIDDVRIYNRAFSATEVTELYKQGLSISR